MDSYYVIVTIHILVGFILVFIAARAYRRTKFIPMLLLTLGFFLIVIGDTVLGDFLNINDESTMQMIEELTEISGFIMVIIAVIKT